MVDPTHFSHDAAHGMHASMHNYHMMHASMHSMRCIMCKMRRIYQNSRLGMEVVFTMVCQNITNPPKSLARTTR